MKKLITLLAALTLTLSLGLSLVACGGSKVVDDEKKITEAGVIKIGMECNYKPFNWTQNDDSNGAVPISNVSGKYAYGYDVMIAKEIAKDLGVNLEIVMLEWDALLASLDSGLIDGVIAGMSPTAERRLTNDFSDPYYSSNLVVLCKAGSTISTATNLTDLNKPDYKIAAQSGTFHYKALSEQLSDCTVTRVETFALMHSQLDSNLIDGYIAELPTALTYCHDSSDYAYVALVNNDTGFTVTDDDVAIAVAMRKKTNYLGKVNAALAKITAEQRAQMMETAIALQATGLDL